jgi:membrane protein DedA with SNARE-associated domain
MCTIFIVLTGDIFLFWLSRRGSKYIDKIQKKFKEGTLLKYKNLMRDNIGITVFLLRFIIGVRLFGPILAGALKAKWITFLAYDTLALIIYVPVFVFLGYHFP